MSEVLFYHLERQPLKDVLPLLLHRTLERGWKAVVQTATDEEAEGLSKIIWSWREDSFIPHGTKADGNEELQAIWLCANDDTPNDAEVRFMLAGTMAKEPGRFQRLVHLFDGHDPDAVNTAREHWKQLKEAGHEMTYWQQNETGKWQKMA